MRASGVTKRSSFFSRKAGRVGVQSAQVDFWPELRHRSMVVLSRMHVAVPADLSAAIQADEKHSGVCPQRSEDSRQSASLDALFAINFGGYCCAYPSSVPVGNTGTTSTGLGV